MSRETEQPPDYRPQERSRSLSAHLPRLKKSLSCLAADTAACIRFLSRLPIARVNNADTPAAPPDFSRIARAAPLAGAAIALPAAALGTMLGYTALPALAAAALTAAVLSAATGALHEDGLSDVADGFFGGATREKRLEIMKDSRIGAFGALALSLSVVLRVSLLAALWHRFSPADAALLFLAAEAVSRCLMVWQWQQRQLASPDGLAARFGKPNARVAGHAALLTLPFLLPAWLLLPLPALFLALFIATTAAYAIGSLGRVKIGGVTGDVLGAIQQISGLGFLTGMLMVP